MRPIISIQQLSKTCASGFQALKPIDLEIRKGEIFALLAPNGAGKTTLISIICGVVNPTAGTVLADGHDVVRDYRAARMKIGLVPQELTTDSFETMWNAVSFSRGLFGRPANPAYIEKVLRDLSLWNKKDHKMITLSGGMKRRVMIAKALSHEPRILFLDEPTARVDVELRRDRWEMADRIGVINKGELILVEDKAALMNPLGRKQLSLQLQNPLQATPAALDGYALELSEDRMELVYSFDTHGEHSGIDVLLRRLAEAAIDFSDLKTNQSSLEDIFVDLVEERT